MWYSKHHSNLKGFTIQQYIHPPVNWHTLCWKITIIFSGNGSSKPKLMAGSASASAGIEKNWQAYIAWIRTGESGATEGRAQNAPAWDGFGDIWYLWYLYLYTVCKLTHRRYFMVQWTNHLVGLAGSGCWTTVYSLAIKRGWLKNPLYRWRF